MIRSIPEPIIAIVVVFVGAPLLAYAIANYSCKTYGDVTGLETKMAFASCYVRHGDTWMSKSDYRAVISLGEKR